METKTKKRRYLKFEGNAVISTDIEEKPFKDLEPCGLCSVTEGKPVYHFKKISEAK